MVPTIVINGVVNCRPTYASRESRCQMSVEALQAWLFTELTGIIQIISPVFLDSPKITKAATTDARAAKFVRKNVPRHRVSRRMRGIFFTG